MRKSKKIQVPTREYTIPSEPIEGSGSHQGRKQSYRRSQIALWMEMLEQQQRRRSKTAKPRNVEFES